MVALSSALATSAPESPNPVGAQPAQPGESARPANPSRSAAEPAEQFARANRLYEEGRFSEAAADLEGLVESGFESPALYFNLGNALLKAGELGEAIVYYERARALDPRAPDIRANLAYARSLAADVMPESASSPFLDALARVKDSVSAAEMVRVSAALFWLTAGAAALSRLSPARRRTARGLAAGLLVAFGLAASLAAIKVNEAMAKRAVVVIPGLAARTGPGDTYSARFELHEGTAVQVEREAGEWTEIQLTEALSGWVPRSSLMRL
jgi:tetratricopeptide (TPR) repeat protein